MRASVTQAAVRASSREAAESGLRAAGFRRQGNHLNRLNGELVHGIHFQASQWGTARDGSFTVNLVVTSEFLYRAWTGEPLPANPATALFPIAQRIGLLMPGRSDYWWRVSAEIDVDSVAAHVATMVVEHALPFFAAFADHDAILACLRNGRAPNGLLQGQIPLVHAMLAARAGCLAEAKERLESAVALAGASAFRKTVILVGSRLGLAVGAS
jgi:hypothetical protein